MLTLVLKSGEKRQFNLKSFEREKALRDAWHAMHGDPKYAGKSFRVATRECDRFEVAVDDIVSTEQEDTEYFKFGPSDVVSDSNPPPKEGSTPTPGGDIIEKLENGREAAFVDYLRGKGVEPDYLDPFFIKVLSKVRRDDHPGKLPIYANMYINSTRGK